jgi:hypothetical protein
MIFIMQKIDPGTKDTYKWEFKTRFRRHAFGWKSQPAITRIKEAIKEIKTIARKESAIAAEGAVIFFERISPAIEHVDSSSGSIGSAVYNAIEQLVPIIAAAPVDTGTRSKWLERLWEAHAADQMPYIEQLADHWGDLCASKAMASIWADRLIETVRLICGPESRPGDYFHGTSACLSALLKAERYEELFELLSESRLKHWTYQEYAVRAMAAQGRSAEAVEHAEKCRGIINTSGMSVSRVCEEILLASGEIDTAYSRYAIDANTGTSHLATYRAIAKKYPHIAPDDILTDLIATTPGDEGKWFAAAKDLGKFDLAIDLASKSPCDPRTLTRASRDYVDTEPLFAMHAGLAALYWLIQGYGYEITGLDVLSAYSETMKAAEMAGHVDEVVRRLKLSLEGKNAQSTVVQILSERLRR